MRPEARVHLWEAIRAADRIARFTTGRTFESYQHDELLRSGVERQFEIIGEALAQLRKIDPETASQIPDIAQVVAFRNVLIHGYASVEARLVWGVVEGSLPALRGVLQKLLDES